MALIKREFTPENGSVDTYVYKVKNVKLLLFYFVLRFLFVIQLQLRCVDKRIVNNESVHRKEQIATRINTLCQSTIRNLVFKFVCRLNKCDNALIIALLASSKMSHTQNIRRSIRASKDQTPVCKYYLEGELLSEVEDHPYLGVELNSSF